MTIEEICLFESKNYEKKQHLRSIRWYNLFQAIVEDEEEYTSGECSNEENDEVSSLINDSFQSDENPYD